MDPTAVTTVGIDWVTLIPQVGFGGIIFAAFMFLLKWVLKTQEKILDNSKEERDASQSVIQGYLKALEQMNVQVSDNHKQVTEAHGYQRAEHEKMLQGLDNVCFISEQNAKCLEKIKDNLEEQGKALARINGIRSE